MSAAKNYTVPELKELCKKHKIPVSGKVKRELEEALVAKGENIPVTGKPRSPQKAAPAAPASATVVAASAAASSSPSAKSPATAPASAPAPVLPPVDYVKLTEIYDDMETTSLIPLAEIDDLEKLKAQIRLDMSDRERQEDADFDYVELIIKKRLRFTKAAFLDLAPHEIVRWSQVVYMY
jgi:hypothetical protein